MIRRLRSLALALTILTPVVLVSGQEEARAEFRIGPNFGLGFGNDYGAWNGVGVDPTLGVDAWIRVADLNDWISIHVNPSMGFHFLGSNSWMLSFDVNAPFLFDLENDVIAPYALAGFGIRHASLRWKNGNPFVPNVRANTTGFAFNIGGGALFLPNGNFNPFVQLQTSFVADGGIDVPQELIGGILFKF